MARRLYELGHDVIAIDTREEVVDAVGPRVTRALVGDGTRRPVLDEIGASRANAAIVSTGTNLGASVLVQLAMRDLGVDEVYIKVHSDEHARIAQALGATEAISPENEVAESLASRIRLLARCHLHPRSRAAADPIGLAAHRRGTRGPGAGHPAALSIQATPWGAVPARVLSVGGLRVWLDAATTPIPWDGGARVGTKVAQRAVVGRQARYYAGVAVMQALTLDELDRLSRRFDEEVSATADIDHFCSSSLWAIPAARALMSARVPWIHRGEHGWVAMMHGRHPEGWTYLEPLEAMWGLACPIVGADGARAAGELAELARARAADWNVMLLAGLPLGSQMLAELTQRMIARYEIYQGQITTRHVASLEGGVDGFLGRRSRNFRKSLRQALRATGHAGIEFASMTTCDPAEARELFQRIMAIEERSWKSREGVGVNMGAMHVFYKDMVPRLAERGALRVIIARRGDTDIAYVLGGLLGDTYRGLQFSFDDDFRGLSLGNVCQYMQIVELCSEGVGLYDLGTSGLDYKHRWAELTRDSLTLIVVRRLLG